MDFDALINGMIAAGDDAESIAKKFTETLNKITAANKRKEEVGEYLDDARAAVYNALQGKCDFDFKVAAKAQVIAAAAYRPGFTVSQYKEMEDAFLEATKWSVELYEDLVKETPKSMKSWSDDEKLMDFLRKAGLSGR